MAKLNDKNETTKNKIHIMVTSLCNRNCRYCCNKQYDLNSVPYVTDEELRDAERLFLTGGEPFLFSNPCGIAATYKEKYKNIKSIYVYTNAYELGKYLYMGGKIHDIDGVTVSIKNRSDLEFFEDIVSTDKRITELSSNLLYVFDDNIPQNTGNFVV